MFMYKKGNIFSLIKGFIDVELQMVMINNYSEVTNDSLLLEHMIGKCLTNIRSWSLILFYLIFFKLKIYCCNVMLLVVVMA